MKYKIFMLVVISTSLFAKESNKLSSNSKFIVKEYVRVWDEGKYIYVFLNKLKSTYTPMVFDGEKEPEKIPDVEEDKKSLNGSDLNNNKLRDDIEIYLNRNIKDEKLRRMLKKYSREMIKLSHDVSKKTPQEVAIVYKNLYIYFGCISKYNDSLKLKDGFKFSMNYELFYNNKLRYDYFRSISDYSDKYELNENESMQVLCKKIISEEK